MADHKIAILKKQYPQLGKLRYFIIGDGKSGTTTVWQSLLAGGAKGRSSIHAHCNGSLWKFRYPQLQRYNIGLPELIQFAHQTSHRQPLIIYTFREPISRTISAFFENLVKFSRPSERRSAPVLCKRLDEHFLTEDYHTCEHPEYFDGFNPYEAEFDKTRGWSLYATEHCRILFLKFECMKNWQEGIMTALANDERNDFKWKPSYLSSQKGYYNVYQQVKREFRPSREKLDQKFERHEKWMNHFYTDEEIATLKASWYAKVR